MMALPIGVMSPPNASQRSGRISSTAESHASERRRRRRHRRIGPAGEAGIDAPQEKGEQQQLATPGTSQNGDLSSRSQAQTLQEPAISAIAAPT
jgi:hypothetical protein